MKVISGHCFSSWDQSNFHFNSLQKSLSHISSSGALAMNVISDNVFIRGMMEFDYN